MPVPPREERRCRGACPYCDDRSSGHPLGYGATALGHCGRTESELIYRRLPEQDREPDPWSPAALLRAAFADRLQGS